LKVSHKAPRVLHKQVMWVVYSLFHAPCTNEQCKGNMTSSTRLVQMSHMDLKGLMAL